MDRKVCFAAAACCTHECPMERCGRKCAECENCMFRGDRDACDTCAAFVTAGVLVPDPGYTKEGEDE